MPLSEHEERILAEIERQLAEEDPRFVARSRRRTRRGWSRTARLRLAVAIGVVGFICLLGLTFSFAMGAAGMALLLVSIILGVTAIRDDDDSVEAQVPPDEQS